MISCLLVPLLSVLINIRSQSDFDSLQVRLDSVLRAGQPERIEIRFHPGVYFYREGHITLYDVHSPGTEIAFSGENCTLIAEDNGRGHQLDNNYVDLKLCEPVDVWSPVRKAGSWPVPVLFRPNEYKIRCQEPDIPPEQAKDLWVHLTQWFIAPFYPVVEIRNGWLYFRKDREYETGIWAELRYGRCLPRYILCDKPERNDLHACTVSRFLTVSDTRLKGLSMENLRFLGNGEGKSLICFDRFQADSVLVSDCSFSHIRSHAIQVSYTDHVCIKDCLFSGNYQSCIRVMEGSRNANIQKNRFIGNGRMMTNVPLVFCRGVDYRIQDNYFEDFSYSAIGLGIHFTEEDIYGTSGIVERNEICQSEQFRSGVFRSLVDAGAIYIGTNNTRTVVRNNYIHDIDGPHYNRGIFADDGPKNVTIEGNTVLRIYNGYCIDLRKCLRVSHLRDTKVPDPNTGNRISGNIYDGRVRMYIRKDDPTSYVGGNRKVCE